jgi:hypothetical protein
MVVGEGWQTAPGLPPTLLTTDHRPLTTDYRSYGVQVLSVSRTG